VRRHTSQPRKSKCSPRRKEGRKGSRLGRKETRNKSQTKHLKEETKAQMASLISLIEDTNETFQVLRDTFVSWMDAHHKRIMACLG
jgi:hypothetical protein